MASETETLVAPLSDLISDTVISTPASIPTIPRNVRTELSYYTPPEDGGPRLPIYIKDEKSRVTSKRDFHPVTVYDVRESGVEHTLDKTGIQFVNHKSMMESFDDDATIKESYYSEVADLLYKVTGASKVHVFHHVVRKAHTHLLYLEDDASQKDEEEATKDEVAGTSAKKIEENPIPAELQGPVRGVHIDQSYAYAPELVKAKFPGEEGERLIKSRFQIINIWRPIKTIFKDPFAVLDARTVLEEELVPITVVYPTYKFESFNVREPKGREDGGHRWWYMSKQSPEEVLVFKIFDSKTDGRARRVPHSSFTDQEFEGLDARQSVEVRALVFHENDME